MSLASMEPSLGIGHGGALAGDTSLCGALKEEVACINNGQSCIGWNKKNDCCDGTSCHRTGRWNRGSACKNNCKAFRGRVQNSPRTLIRCAVSPTCVVMIMIKVLMYVKPPDEASSVKPVKPRPKVKTVSFIDGMMVGMIIKIMLGGLDGMSVGCADQRIMRGWCCYDNMETE